MLGQLRGWQVAKYQDFAELVKKYGHPFSDNPVAIASRMNARFFEVIGIAVRRRILNVDIVQDFWNVDNYWKKVKPIAESLRKELGTATVFEGFEYLYNEMKKREQALQYTKD